MSRLGDPGRPAFGSRILRRRQLPPGLAVAAALLLCACHLTGSFQTGPEGQSLHDTELRQHARDEEFVEALELTEVEDSDEIGDELLRLLHRGLLLHYAGEYEESNELLQEAERIIDDRYTKSVSVALLSLVTSDRALAWLPSPTERLMVNYYGALNYLALGDPEEAAVEARRLSRLLQLSEDGEFAHGQLGMRRMLRYFAGSVFEISGNDNDAAVAYRHVWSPADDLSSTPLRPRSLYIWDEAYEEPEEPDVSLPERDIDFVVDSVLAAQAAAREGRTELEQDGQVEPLTQPDAPRTVEGPPEPPPVVEESGPPPVALSDLVALNEGPGGDVVVFLELGLVSHRVERSLNVPIFPEEASGFDSSDADVRYATASCVAARSFGGRYDFTPMIVQAGADWGRSSDGKCSTRSGKRARPSKDEDSEKDGEKETDREAYFLRVAWPEMVPSGLPTDLTVTGLAVAADVEPLRLAALGPLTDSLALPALDSMAAPASAAEPPVLARPAMTGSVSGAVTEEFDQKLGGILIKAVARAALKYEVARGLEKELGEEDETLGDIAFYAANAAGALFERADTRSWHLLPDRLQVVRLRLPPGTHPLTLDVDLGDGTRRSVDLGTVRVVDGRVLVLSARVWP